jgi:hypothetical protein
MRLMVDASAIGVPSKLVFECRGGVDGLAEEVAGKAARACDSFEVLVYDTVNYDRNFRTTTSILRQTLFRHSRLLF